MKLKSVLDLKKRNNSYFKPTSYIRTVKAKILALEGEEPDKKTRKKYLLSYEFSTFHIKLRGLKSYLDKVIERLEMMNAYVKILLRLKTEKKSGH